MTKAQVQGRLSITAPAEASILVDGRAVGSRSWSGMVLSGTHVVRVTAPKKIPYEKQVAVRGNENRDVTVSLESEEGDGMPTWAWIFGGTVLAGGIAAGGYYVANRDSR